MCISMRMAQLLLVRDSLPRRERHMVNEDSTGPRRVTAIGQSHLLGGEQSDAQKARVRGHVERAGGAAVAGFKGFAAGPL